MKLKKKDIYDLFIKTIEEELGAEEAKIPIGFGDLDFVALKLSNIQDMKLREQKVKEKIEDIKQMCKTPYFRD